MSLSSIFKMLLLSSVIGSVVSIIILIIKSLFKTKLNATWQYYIWFLLIIRLIIPSGFETPLSKFNMVALTTERIQVSQNLPKITTNNAENTFKNNAKTSKTKLEKKSNLKETKVKDINYYLNVASIAWAVGAILAALIILSINGVLFFKVNKQPFCNDKDTIEVLEKCKSIMNISRPIPIVCDRYIKTPSLFGAIDPKILISPDLIYRLSFEEKKYIFLHELSHFKRKDIFIRWIMLFCGIVNWFNPIIWFAFHRMWEDSEIACDAYVLSYLEEKEQSEYGKTIIDLLKFVSDIKWMPGTTGIISGKSNIKRRIIMIKKFKKYPRKWIIATVCSLTAVVMIGTTNIPIKATTLTSKRKLLETKQSNINYVNIVKGFLPQNSQIVTPSNTKEEDNVLIKDLDNDDMSEIITAYKLAGEDEKINILVLKKVGTNWIKALDESGEGFKLDSALTEDIDGDGQNEILLSRRIGGTVAQLSLYKWNNNLLNKISNEDVYYSKLDIVNISGKNTKAIAIWQHDTGDSYKVDVLKWDGKTFVSSEDLYPNYFKKSVVPYYEQKVKEMPEARFYWYYLADAQVKAEDKSSAIKSIEKGLKLNSDYPSKEEFNKLKEKVSK
jgi:bla regulator protein BlaR1